MRRWRHSRPCRIGYIRIARRQYGYGAPNPYVGAKFPDGADLNLAYGSASANLAQQHECLRDGEPAMIIARSLGTRQLCVSMSEISVLR
jgi:hypothetical protein